MRLTRVLETVLYYDAGEEAEMRRFYADVLGLSPVGNGFAFRIGDGLVLLFDAEQTARQDWPPAHGAHGPGHACFVAPPSEYDAWNARLDGHVGVTREIEWPNGVRSFYFEDPAGNVLEIADGDLWPR